MALQARWWCSPTDLRCLILATLLHCSVGLLNYNILPSLSLPLFLALVGLM
ncbi:hypothetical protein P154DRAFT_522472 [Amniculicola lignicola CBS 123094]|uniref:Uncharacterized protein n=1 Tax=Amniculicola lignicola CBS 123094 TaxID=1392246 RepID=A0A6A5WND5_9PLEO|nr:hypothetical protein P154DRAFT_522472 [Amniculicola lignicola CBS 123094]